jgi:cyclopropane fatty-acyl-phospholipid synthase-like methyltransferase
MSRLQTDDTIYNVLSGYYDDLVKDEQAYHDWLEWMHPYLKGNSILELACGSGEITLLLAKDGYKMQALDLSEGMIKQAKAKDIENQIEYSVHDMCDLDGYGCFDNILCLCDSFNYLLDKKQVEDFFAGVAAHLNAGGRFFFDTHALDRLEEFEEEFNETGAFVDGVQYQWSIMSEDEYVYQDFAFYRPEGLVQEHHIQRVYEPEWLLEQLKKHFQILSVKTDFIEEGIAPGEKYFYICEKK